MFNAVSHFSYSGLRQLLPAWRSPSSSPPPRAASLGVSYVKIEVDAHKAAGALRPLLRTASGVSTLPLLFVNGKFVGTCEQIKEREAASDLAVLAPFMTQPRVPEGGAPRRRTARSLFWFPHTVNYRAARIASFGALVVCILCIAFWTNPATPWVVLALAVDFSVRFLFGSGPSFLGALSVAVASFWEPTLRAGPPKQFAALCGTFFSVFSAGLFLGGQRVGGAVVLGCLMGAAALEFFS